MADIPRSTEDIILDRMVTALQAFSASQTIAVRFSVERDRVRMPSMSDMPLVNIWLDSDTPVREGSSSRLQVQGIARINVDCYAAGKDDDGDGYDESKAMARLYYLKEQTRYGLYSLVNADFGFSPGVIARKRWPTWQLFQNELKLPETEVVAGRWTLEIEYSWTPQDIEGITLDEIAVNAGLWSGLYTYGG
jgi:hypothetical protein